MEINIINKTKRRLSSFETHKRTQQQQQQQLELESARKWQPTTFSISKRDT